MSAKEKSSSLIIERDPVTGSVAVTGWLTEGDETSLEEAIEAVRPADQDVVIILSHGVEFATAPEGGAPASVEEARQVAEPASSLQAVATAVARALGQRQSMLGLIEQLSPAADVPPPAAVLQARRNAEARHALLEEHGVLTAPEVSDLAGSTADNRSALATRWRKEGRIFAVFNRGALRYPVFQFGFDGRPRPVIAEILASFAQNGLAEWEIALWFTTRNGWLEDARPVDLLESDPEAVLEAARHEVDPIAG